MSFIEKLVGLLSRTVAALGSLATVICLLMVGYAVVMRYIFGAPQPWVDQTAGWMVVALVMLAAPEAQRRFEHIGVDIAVSKLGPRLARLAHLLGALSVVLVAAILFQAGWEAVAFSRMVGLMTDIEGIPQWWIQLLLPIGGALLFLVALCQALLLAIGREPAMLPRPGDELTRDPLARAE